MFLFGKMQIIILECLENPFLLENIDTLEESTSVDANVSVRR